MAREDYHLDCEFNEGDCEDSSECEDCFYYEEDEYEKAA